MSAYFGSQETQRLQRKSDLLMPRIMETPGLCVTGRLMAADNWRAVDWNMILKHLEQDRMFGFRWIPPEDTVELRETFADIGINFFEWNGFMGERETLDAPSRKRLNDPLPQGFVAGSVGPDRLPDVQAFLADHGISPLSADLMGGVLCPAMTLVIADQAGAIVAAGFTGMLQNRFSALADCAWMGLIAVAPSIRGHGLGSYVAARLCQASLTDLGAERVIAFAAPDNAASIAMLTGAGLAPSARKSCVAAISDDRPTR